MRIYIVSHGETDANKKGYAQGRTDDRIWPLIDIRNKQIP